MFSEIRDAIRAYVIRKIAEQVASDIVTNGLTPEDQTIIDSILNADHTP